MFLWGGKIGRGLEVGVESVRVYIGIRGDPSRSVEQYCPLLHQDPFMNFYGCF